MAIKVFDGFDHYGGSDILNRGPNFLQYEDRNTSFNFVTGRNGYGKAISSGFTCTFGQRVASAFIGHAIWSAGGFSMVFSDSVANSPQVSVVFNHNDFLIEVYLGGSGDLRPGTSGTQLYYGPSKVWTPNTWNYVEIWPTIDQINGSVQIRVNGQILVNLTSINTQATANAFWDKYQVQGDPFATFLVDDFYYADTTIDAPTYLCNMPLGDMRVFTAFPIGNCSVAWSPQPNTNANWQNFYDPAFFGDTTYNYTSEVGAEDLFNFSAMVGTVNKIVAVQVTGAYRKDDATMRTLKQALKSGVTVVYGATHSLPDNNYVYFTDLWLLDPATAASWTLTGVNGLAAGYNLVS